MRPPARWRCARIAPPDRRRDAFALETSTGRDSDIGGGPNTILAPEVLTSLKPILQRPEGRIFYYASEYSTEFSGYVEGALAVGEVTAMQVAGQFEARTAGRRARPLLAALLWLGHFAAKLEARVVGLFARQP